MRTTSAANSPIRFGTDGVRGPAGTWPLTAEGARIIGHGVGLWAQRFRSTPVVVVGRDTRESGDWIAQAVEQGLLASGASVLHAGVLPTAAVSCAVVHHNAQAGIMVTASHNPWHDNGLKVLGPDGRKPSDAKEIEAFFASQDTQKTHAVSGRTIADPAAPWRADMPQVDLGGWRILLDCAHGAAAPHAPALDAIFVARVSAKIFSTNVCRFMSTAYSPFRWGSPASSERIPCSSLGASCGSSTYTSSSHFGLR